MNKRIEELMALSAQITLTDIARTNIQLDSVEFYDLQFAKFAELIVKECTSIVQGYITRWPEDTELTKLIKAHFGIEK